MNLPSEFDAVGILNQAARLVGADRELDYGIKHHNFANIGRLWTAYLESRRDPEMELDGVDVGHMLALLKIARTQSGDFKLDNYVDGAGYIACAGEIAADHYEIS